MYEMKSRVGLDAADVQGYMGYDAIVREMVNCATYQVQDTVYDVYEMRKKDRGWFVVSWQVNINALPVMGQKLIVRTFPYEFKGFIGKRHFAILSEDEKPFVFANSMWTWMDLENARPVRIPDFIVNGFEMDSPPEGDWRSRKLPVPEELLEQYRFNVSPMFLDSNGHMNNSYYLTAAQRCLTDGMRPGAFYVEYRKQAMPDDEVIVFSHRDEEATTSIMKNPDGEIYAVVRFE